MPGEQELPTREQLQENLDHWYAEAQAESGRAEKAESRVQELEGERDDYLRQIQGDPCPRCDGEGMVEFHDPSMANANDPDGAYDDACPDCSGRGHVYGTGLQDRAEALERITDVWDRHGVAAPTLLRSAINAASALTHSTPSTEAK